MRPLILFLCLLVSGYSYGQKTGGSSGTVTGGDNTTLSQAVSNLSTMVGQKLNVSDTLNKWAAKPAGLSSPERTKLTGLPATPVYTQAQVNTLLQGYYLPTPVATKMAAIAIATGSQPRIITVAVDESDNNATGNKYIYDGNNQPLGYPLF
ncbi:MAG: hypothetical protein EOO39_28085 [Cytophagaceae bacterium]|nr:MAG: hypothetical protein EOO39_28085 [Cytophagaceae bacterium]